MNLNILRNWSIQNIFLNPYIIALLPAVFIIIFLIPESGKFKVRHVKSDMTDKLNSIEVYQDIDGDKSGERIILFDHDDRYSTLKIENGSGGLMGWWTFEGRYYHNLPGFNDYDENGKSEIYFISSDNDSIFLNILDLSSISNAIMKTAFIDCISRATGKTDFSLTSFSFCDFQQDGYQEACFSLRGGFALKPRRFYLYDFRNDSLFKGPDLDCMVDFTPFNLDKDPFPEFFSNSGSLNNMPKALPGTYHDHSGWVMALDNDLSFQFTPLEFPGHKSSISTYPVYVGDSLYLLGLYDFYGEKPADPVLYLFDLKGRIVRQKKLNKPNETFYYNILHEFPYHLSEVLLFDKSANIYSISDQLDLKRKKSLHLGGFDLDAVLDIDNDNENELIFSLSDGESMVVTRHDFSHPVRFKTPFFRGRVWVSVQERRQEQPRLVIVQGQRRFLYEYSPDVMYYARFPVWALVYIMVVGFIHLIRRLQRIQQEKVKALSSRLAELQLAGINNQMNPHFTMNVMNTISSYIYREEKEKAYNYFISYTKLIRSTLEMSDKISQTIQEEVNFLENYLELEKIRWENPFEFFIHIEPGVDRNMHIPKMLMQLHVENALKHGLRNKGPGGKLWIDLIQTEHLLDISIRDNGIGRNAASALKQESTGKGYLIMDKMIDLYLRLEKVKIEYEVIDLYSEYYGTSGTEVRIKMNII